MVVYSLSAVTSPCLCDDFDLQIDKGGLMTNQALLLLTFSSLLMLFGCEDSSVNSPTNTMALDDSVDRLSDREINESKPLDMEVQSDQIDQNIDPIIGHDPVDCDPLQPEYCVLPWPSDHFQKGTPNQSLLFAENSLPQNFQGASFNPQGLSRLDGYGLLATGIVYFENIDPNQLPNEEQIEQSMNDMAVAVLIELTDSEEGTLVGRRIPCWAEVDLRAPNDGPRAVFIRPAQLLKPNQRYLYALLNLRNMEGDLISASPAFASLRDGGGIHLEGDRLVSSTRRDDFNKALNALEETGVDRHKLTLAWGFKTASKMALTNDLLTMRDQGLSIVEADGVRFDIEEVIQFRRSEDPVETNDSRRINEYIAYELRGTFEVPNFMESDGVLPGEYQIHRDALGIPVARGVTQAPFWLRIPYIALADSSVGVVLYGHGQLYSGAEVQMGDKGPVAEAGRYIYLGTDLWGMSEDELPLIPQILNQMDRFTAIADRLHQGVFNHLVLARAAKGGLEDIPWLGDNGIQIDSDRIVYGGISQGGIFGPTILALSQDITRGHFGVPGMHYFTLIGRSRNFSAMFALLSVAYSDPVDRWIALAAAQLMWNKTDPTTYYRHLDIDPLPNTPIHRALLTPAQGDPQVSQLTIEHLARSEIQMPIIPPYGGSLPPLVELGTYPHQGSAIVAWHYGPRVPNGSRAAPAEHHDPHNVPRNDQQHNQQMIHFWNTGEVIDLCSEEHCGDWRP